MGGPVVQSVASLIADPGVRSLILAWSHNFVEINHEIFSTVILLLQGLFSVTHKVLVNCLPRKKCG